MIRIYGEENQWSTNIPAELFLDKGVHCVPLLGYIPKRGHILV